MVFARVVLMVSIRTTVFFAMRSTTSITTMTTTTTLYDNIIIIRINIGLFGVKRRREIEESEQKLLFVYI